MVAATVQPNYAKGVLSQVKKTMTNTNHVANSLRTVEVERELFDPANPQHRAAFKNFSETGKWDIRFHPEAPYRNVVHMIERRLIDYALSL